MAQVRYARAVGAVRDVLRAQRSSRLQEGSTRKGRGRRGQSRDPVTLEVPSPPPGEPVPQPPDDPGRPSPSPDPPPPDGPAVPEPSPPQQPDPDSPDVPEVDPKGPETLGRRLGYITLNVS